MDLWYVCRIKPNCERQARRHLDRQGFENYLPMLSVRRLDARTGVMSMRDVPLFPGYIFLLLDLEGEHWKHVGGTRGVIALLPSSDNPSPISSEQVAGLQEAERAGLYKRGGVKAGEQVLIFRGTLAGQILQCLEVDGDRIKCLMMWLGAERVIHVDAQNVSVLR